MSPRTQPTPDTRRPLRTPSGDAGRPPLARRAGRGSRGAWAPLAALLAGAVLIATAPGCREKAPTDRIRVSGYVEATEVQVSSEVAGRLVTLSVAEGTRVTAGQLIAKLDTADVELALRRTKAERQASDAQLRLLLAGSREEDIRQADAQRAAAVADLAAFNQDLAAAERDLTRFQTLLSQNSGTQKARDDAASRRDVAKDRVKGAEERVRAATEVLGRLRAGARREEVDAARARVSVVDAQIATLEKALNDATVNAPANGIVTQKLVDQGELVAPRTPLVVIADLDNVWANVYVDEPYVPRLALGQKATLFTDAGGTGIEGTITFVSSKAEFTPRNVQTAEERSKLVYRIKVTVDNKAGVLKQGMPIEAELKLAAR
jgi:HlyD family secretion protein